MHGEREAAGQSQSVREDRGIVLPVYIGPHCPEAERKKGRSARQSNELNESNTVCCHVSNVVVCNYCYCWEKHLLSPGRALPFTGRQLTRCETESCYDIVASCQN